MHDVLVQRKQMRPLGGKAKKPDDMNDDDWEELDALMPYVTCSSGGRYRPFSGRLLYVHRDMYIV